MMRHQNRRDSGRCGYRGSLSLLPQCQERLAHSNEPESDWREVEMKRCSLCSLCSAVADQNSNQCQVETSEGAPKVCVVGRSFFIQPFITVLHPSLTAWSQQQR